MPKTRKPETPLDFCMSFDQILKEKCEQVGLPFKFDVAFEEATREAVVGQAVHFLEGYHRAKKEGDIGSEFDISVEISIPFRYLFLYQNLIEELFAVLAMYQLGVESARKSNSLDKIHGNCDYIEESVRAFVERGFSMPPEVDVSTLNLN